MDARSVTDLIAAGHPGTPPLLFWGRGKPGTDPHGFVLSQWYTAPFADQDGHQFTTAEQYMMWRKAHLFEDADVAAKILTASNPKDVKALGRQVAGFDEDTWAQHRMSIVVAGSVLKFSAEPRRADYLISTAGRVLVETSPYDRIWGIGLAADTQAATDPTRWKGMNLLGFALMEARAQLMA